MKATQYKLYRKMSLEEYANLQTSGLTIIRDGDVCLCPKKCLSESLISVYRLNPYRAALSPVIAELSLPLDIRSQLIDCGIKLAHDMHADKAYDCYRKYDGQNIYYKCHGSSVDLYNHEIDTEQLALINGNIHDIRCINLDNYKRELLKQHLNVDHIETLVTNKGLANDEYYIQLPFDLAILALQFNTIPSGGLNKFIKERIITKDCDYLDEINKGVFPVTLAVKIDNSIKSSRIRNHEIAPNTYSIDSNMLMYLNKLIKGIRMISYIEQRGSYKYASEVLNNAVSIHDVLNGRINNSDDYDSNQITIEEALNIIESSKIKDYFKELITNINENLYLPSDYHGVTHAQRVCLYSFLIATYMGLPEKDIKLLIQTSLLHDIGRLSDYDDKDHGSLGAKRIDELALFINDKESRNIVQFLIECHELELDEEIIAEKMRKYNIPNSEINIILLSILMDADALDRTRFTVFGYSQAGLNTSYLRTPFSKKLVDLSKTISKAYYNNTDMSLIKRK